MTYSSSTFFGFIVLLFCCSAFFSAAEAVYLSTDRILIGRLRRSGALSARLALFFLRRIDVFVVTLLCANLLANISSTLLATRLFESALLRVYQTSSALSFLPAGVFIALGDVAFIFLFTSAVLIFCEFIPKRLAVAYRAPFLSFSALPLGIGYVVFSLPAMVVVFFVRLLNHTLKARLLEGKHHREENGEPEEGAASFFKFDKSHFLSYVKLGGEKGVLQKQESHLLEGLIGYMNTPVKSFLIPREKVVGLDLSHLEEEREAKSRGKSRGLLKLLQAVKKLPYTQIPIYDKSLDNLKGVFSKKKMTYLKLPASALSQREFIAKYLEKPAFIPENKNVLEALGHIYHSPLRLAIISDEYGGIEGIVTYQDIIRKLLRFSQAEVGASFKNSSLRLLPEGSYYARADLFLNDLNKQLQVNLVCEKAETLGGYLLEKFRCLPKRGDSFRDEFFEYRIRYATNRRIVSLELRFLTRQ